MLFMKEASEKEIQDAAADLLRMKGWLVFHSRTSQTGGRYSTAVGYDGVGFFDLTALHPKLGVAFVEVKTHKNRQGVTTNQKTWGLTAMAAESQFKTPGHMPPIRYFLLHPERWPTFQDEFG